MASYRILIIEDDPDQGPFLKEILEEEFHHVTLETNAESALEKINSGLTIDILLTDINLPGMNGITFLKEVQSKLSDVQFIIMSGFIESIQGIQGLIYSGHIIIEKPFSPIDLIAHIDSYSPDESMKEYHPIPIGEILTKKDYPLDLFISLSERKYLKMFPKGEQIDSVRLKRLVEKGYDTLFVSKQSIQITEIKQYIPIRTSMLHKGIVEFNIFQLNDENYDLIHLNNKNLSQEKINQILERKIKKLYIEDKDEPLYQAYLEKQITTFISDKKISIKEKAEAVTDVTSNALKKFIINPDEKTIEKLKNVQTNLICFLDDSPMAGQVAIRQLKIKDSGLYRHSVNVATLSYATVQAIIADKNNSNLTIFKSLYIDEGSTKEILFMGGLLHELGSPTVNQKIINGQKFSPAEKRAAIIEAGYEIAKKIPNIRPKVLEIILQSEEFCNGTGIPRGIKKAQMSIFAQIVSLANYYDTKVTIKGEPPLDTIMEIQEESEKFNKYIIPYFYKVASAKGK